MIDPLTITASIGFGLAVISFLSNSVSTLTRQGTEFERCKQLLTGYSYQLKDREKNLLAWRFHWYGDYGYSEDTYYYCWGNDYEEFKERFKEIRKLMSDLAGHMALQPESGEFPGLLKGEGRDWTDILSCIKKQGWQQPEARNFVGKLAFAISNNLHYSRFSRKDSVTQVVSASGFVEAMRSTRTQRPWKYNAWIGLELYYRGWQSLQTNFTLFTPRTIPRENWI
jgi:hypothetical protein